MRAAARRWSAFHSGWAVVRAAFAALALALLLTAPAHASGPLIRIDHDEARYTLVNDGDEEARFQIFLPAGVWTVGRDADECSDTPIGVGDRCRLRLSDHPPDAALTLAFDDGHEEQLPLAPPAAAPPSVTSVQHSAALPTEPVVQFDHDVTVSATAPAGVSALMITFVATGRARSQFVSCGSTCPASAQKTFHIATEDLVAGRNVVRVTATDRLGASSAAREFTVNLSPSSCYLDAGCAAAARRLDDLHAPSISNDPENALDETADGYESPDGAVIPDDLDSAVELDTDAGALAVTVDDGNDGAGEGMLAADASVVYASENGTDTAVRATDDGVETFTVIPDANADPTVAINLDLPGDERLVEQDDGSVVVLDPTPSTSSSPSTPKPADLAGGTAQSDALRADNGIPASIPNANPNADAAVVQAAEAGAGEPVQDAEPESVPEELDPAAGDEPTGDESTPIDEAAMEARANEAAEGTHDAAVDELEQHMSEADAFDAARTADAQQAAREEARAVAVVKPVWAKDANGDPVATDVSIDGDSVRVSVDPDADAAYPIVVDPWVVAYDTYWTWVQVPIYRTETYIARWVVVPAHLGWVHVGWCFNPGTRCDNWGNGWWSISPPGHFAQFVNEWRWYPSYGFYNMPVYATRTVLSHWAWSWQPVTTAWSEWFEDVDESERGGRNLSQVPFVSDDSWYSGTSEPSATAAWVMAVIWCVRICPAVASAGYRALRVSSTAAKGMRFAALPNAAMRNLAVEWKAIRGSNPGQTLGRNMEAARGAAWLQRFNGSAEQARRWWTAQQYAAHHIVASGDVRAHLAQAVLRSVGIRPNDAINGIWLKACIHQCIHTDLYYRNVNAIFRPYYHRILIGRAPSRFEIELELKKIADMLSRNEFPYHMT